ncbi:predicted protein [Histoplasma mississippiense (nom. inval.)]|uniref:predicted protein n=1 Tax=Ajellomyces capsulatus (strain NAm1 / WU24) TaxID=2059318 RepID=UPI000157D531|nr:predicted protein [Histoplasma mississippiense (nom. inval.)]EDN05294.1 predicted protein [Histoplasma mississippiense (nom. inval.)]
MNVWFPIFNEAYPINPYIESPSRTYFRGTQSLDGHHHHYYANGNTNVNNNNNNKNPRSHPIRGFTETCPAQAGIPGWRRICFMIYEINPEFFVSAVDGNGNGNGFNSGNEGESEEEEWLPWSWTTVDFLWAFGWRNKMAEAEVEEGPFIFWTV